MSGGEHKPKPAGFSSGFGSGFGWVLGIALGIIVCFAIIIGLTSRQPIPGNSGADPQTVTVEQEPEVSPPRSEPEPEQRPEPEQEDADTVCYFETTGSTCDVGEEGADLRLGTSNRPGMYACWTPNAYYSIFQSIGYYKGGELHRLDPLNLPSGVDGYRFVPWKRLRMTIWLSETPCPKV